jgi:hypothetical protein
MGCLFALFGGLFPRLALLIVWIARPALVGAAFNTFLLPLLGIIFLPFATLIYVIVYTPGVGLVGFDWFWVILAVILVLGDPRRPARPGPLERRLHPAEPGTRGPGRVNAQI